MAVQKTILGRRFSIDRVSARNQVKLKVYVLKTFGAALGQLIELAGAEGAAIQVKVDILDNLITSLLPTVDADDLIKYQELVFEGVACEGKAVIFDETFKDGTLAADMLFIECVKVNLGDFFTEARSLLESMKAKKSSELSPPTSTGT